MPQSLNIGGFMATHLEINQYSAFVGIDWADAKHDICLHDPINNKREFSVIKHSVEDIEKWALSLKKRFGGLIAVAVELTKGPIIYALQRYEFLVIVPINPTTLSKYRSAFKPSKAKDDPTDAEIALELMLRYPEIFTPLKIQSLNIRKLMYLVEKRKKLVNDKQRFVNQIINNLKQYYPQAIDWFPKKETNIFCNFIARWPTLQQAQKARRTTLQSFFNDNHIINQEKVEERINEVKSALALTDDEAVIETHAMMVVALVEIISILMKHIKYFDKKIAELMKILPDANLFETLPGAGVCYAARLLVAFGEQRDRFSSANEVQQYSGIAPVTERSGNKCWVHWRWQCSKFLRQTFVEWAAHSIYSSYWANIYYQKKRESGSSHQAAVRALAFKWIRIVYRCWKDRKPYDEVKYLNALKQRGSPLLG